MAISIQQLLAAQLVCAGMGKDAALEAGAKACEALDLPAGALLPLVEIGGASAGGCDVSRCQPEVFAEAVANGVRFSDRAVRSKYKKGVRRCHFVVGGSGREHPPDTPMHYQLADAGPKFKIASGEYKGKEYAATLCPDCLKYLSEKLADGAGSNQPACDPAAEARLQAEADAQAAAGYGF